MNLTLFRQKTYDALTILGLLAVTAGLMVFPAQMVGAAREGVELGFNVLIPSLFPFFVISSLTVELGLAERLGSVFSGVMGPLFNVSGECAAALILGFIGGYPVGARTIISLYEQGRCTKAEAERMLAFCNNSGPAFIFGVVGAGIFLSSSVGLILYLTHMAASILVGLIFRSHGGRGSGGRLPRPQRERVSFPAAFVRAVGSSFTSCLGICGFVIFFTVFTRLLFLSGVLKAVSAAIGTVLGPLGFDEAWAERLLTGFIELTGGVWSLREVSSRLTASVSMAAFMLGWAGLSVHCQVLSFLGSTGLSARTYILGKALHAGISAALAALIMCFVRPSVPVGLILAGQVGKLATLSFSTALRASAMLSGGLLLLFLAVFLFLRKKGGKKERKDV